MTGWLVFIVVLFFLWSLCAVAAKAEPKPPRMHDLKSEIANRPTWDPLAGLTARDRRPARQRLALYGQEAVDERVKGVMKAVQADDKKAA